MATSPGSMVVVACRAVLSNNHMTVLVTRHGVQLHGPPAVCVASNIFALRISAAFKPSRRHYTTAPLVEGNHFRFCVMVVEQISCYGRHHISEFVLIREFKNIFPVFC